MASDRGETLDPARNFTLGTGERVRAIAAGPPAYMRRLRAIEDLEGRIVAVLVDCRDRAAAAGLDRQGQEEFVRGAPVGPLLARLDDLIATHNRFYPTEANLPVCVATGQTMDRGGGCWQPLARRVLDDFVVRAMTA